MRRAETAVQETLLPLPALCSQHTCVCRLVSRPSVQSTLLGSIGLGDRQQRRGRTQVKVARVTDAVPTQEVSVTGGEAWEGPRRCSSRVWPFANLHGGLTELTLL
jgi:hypothetical protein